MKKTQKIALFLLLIMVLGGLSACRSRKYGCPTFNQIEANL